MSVTCPGVVQGRFVHSFVAYLERLNPNSQSELKRIELRKTLLQYTIIWKIPRTFVYIDAHTGKSSYLLVELDPHMRPFG